MNDLSFCQTIMVCFLIVLIIEFGKYNSMQSYLMENDKQDIVNSKIQVSIEA